MSHILFFPKRFRNYALGLEDYHQGQLVAHIKYQKHTRQCQVLSDSIVEICQITVWSNGNCYQLVVRNVLFTLIK